MPGTLHPKLAPATEGLRTLSLLPDPTTVLAAGRMGHGGNSTGQELSTRELGISTPATSPLQWDTNETGFLSLGLVWGGPLLIHPPARGSTCAPCRPGTLTAGRGGPRGPVAGAAKSMAGCGLSEDTFLSSFFYNYGSSWETPSNQRQLQGLSRPSGAHSAMNAYLPPNLPTQREPEKEAGAGALPRTTPGKSRELERNLHQVAAGAAPLCARRPPALQLSPGAA
ncbi:hypothetical protein LEMLEM_LOCUS25135 [Lemmus lemmus]